MGFLLAFLSMLGAGAAANSVRGGSSSGARMAPASNPLPQRENDTPPPPVDDVPPPPVDDVPPPPVDDVPPPPVDDAPPPPVDDAPPPPVDDAPPPPVDDAPVGNLGPCPKTGDPVCNCHLGEEENQSGSEDCHDHHGDAPAVPVPPDAADQATLDAFVQAVKAQPEVHMHGDDDSKMAEHMAAMDLTPRDEATHIAISNGNWFDANTWYGGEVPDDNAKVLIPEGISISYGGLSDARLFSVRVDGELDFETQVDSQMVFDTLVVSPTGSLIIGTADDPVAADVSVELVIANNGPIDVDWDPMLLSRGIISHGKSVIHGAEKDSHEKVIEDPMAGDDTLTFAEAPLGWEVGDTIVVAGTTYDGHKWDNDIRDVRLHESQDEVRVITGIEGNKIFLDQALRYDHDTPREDLFTSVANYSRNVSIKTENTEEVEVHERGHVMFMHSDDVDVRYAEFHELGRTDKSEPSQQASDFADIASDSNVQGRYALHLHRTGFDDLDNPAMVVGNAVWGSPGWGYVHHESNAILENNASFNTFGAGYVAESGNETGAWNDNIAILAQGVSWAEPKNTTSLDTFDTGRGGDGFWFQGRMVESTDNIAASVNTGFVYFHRGGESFDSSLFEHPDALWNDQTVHPDEVPIRVFSGNETFAAREGLHVVKAEPNQGHDIWSTLDSFTAWNVLSGAHLEYTSHYRLENFDLIGREAIPFQAPGDGISFGTNTSEAVILNAQIAGFETGIDLVKSFNSVADPDDEHNYVVIDADIRDVDQFYENYDPSLDQILSENDLDFTQLDLKFDSPLTFEGQTVAIDGTKYDQLGATEFPGGTDDFDISRDEVIHILETDGYWETSEGERYFLTDLYFTDRLSGDLYYETHPVFVEGETAEYLDLPYFRYQNSVNNGEQDILQIGENAFAGDKILDTPISVEPQSAAVMWDALTSGQGTWSDTSIESTESEYQEEADMLAVS